MIEELESLGLKHYEAKVLSILFKERISLRELSKKADVPFGKIYSVVKGLKEKNLVSENNSRPKLVYVENASEIISRLLKDKQEKEKRFNEKLREIVIETDKTRGRETKFFEIGISAEERRRLQLRIFNEAEGEILQIFNKYHNPKINRQSKLEYEKAIEKAVSRGVKIKAIYPDKTELPLILKKLEKAGKFHVKRNDNDFLRTDIADNKVLIKLAHKDTSMPGGTIFIENERLAENLTKIFDEIWENN